MITTPDSNSAYESRRSFTVNKFGYVPKSETFQYLTVSDKFNEQKDRPDLYEIANYQKVTLGQTHKYYVPARSLYVKFHIYQHLSEVLGAYQMCLPKAVPGLKLKVIFSADLKMIGYPDSLDSSNSRILAFKDSGWPTVPTFDTDYDDSDLYSGNRIKVNEQKFEVKCKDSDIFRGISIPFATRTFSDNNPVSVETNHILPLPFEVGSKMTINVTPTTTTMEEILASHAELECIISGQWTAKFHGLWEYNRE